MTKENALIFKITFPIPLRFLKDHLRNPGKPQKETGGKWQW